MVELNNCRKCGRLFTSFERDILCECCRKEDEMVFKSLREYVFDNPGVSALDLAERFNMKITKITRYIKEGKLTIIV